MKILKKWEYIIIALCSIKNLKYNYIKKLKKIILSLWPSSKYTKNRNKHSKIK